MSTNNANEVSHLIATLQTIEQALADPTSLRPVSAQIIAELNTGITHLQKLEGVVNSIFNCVHRRFISREESRQLVDTFDSWAADVFQAGPLVNMTPLYVPATDVGRLVDRATGNAVDRTADKAGYIELWMGKQANRLSILLAAVDNEGNRLYEEPGSNEAGQDLLDFAGPCPLPPCPGSL